jgi:hypothetical protein
LSRKVREGLHQMPLDAELLVAAGEAERSCQPNKFSRRSVARFVLPVRTS